MPRDGSGVYSPPPGSTAVANTVISSTVHNALKDDIAADLNAARPISAGGTGGTSVSTAQAALGVTPQSTTADNTAGRLLLVGGGGWYGTALAVPGDNCNLITATGFYQGVTDVTTNMPVNYACGILHTGSSTRARQIGFGATSLTYMRTLEGATWGAWQPIVTVVSAGANSNGTWIKYSDGSMECQAEVSFTTAIATAFLGGFRCLTRTWTFPATMPAAPKIQVVAANGTAFGAVAGAAASTTSADFFVTSVTSDGSGTRTVNLTAKVIV